MTPPLPQRAPMARDGTYTGRFAPSPTGPLHAGSLVAALGSWLDARAHGGRWLVRIEDVDTPRCIPGMDVQILHQLAVFGLVSDDPPLRQSLRIEAYTQALRALQQQGLVYPCRCSRTDILNALAREGRAPDRHHGAVYPGTCRPGAPGTGIGRTGTSDRPPRLPEGGAEGERPAAWRIRVVHHAPSAWRWTDRRLGSQVQALAEDVGDFVVRRADGLWAYQLAVVVDDAAQGVTDVVRGEDLADNTPRQQWLQQCLSLPHPRSLHLPLVRNSKGEKLSKQQGATALPLDAPLKSLHTAARALGLDGPPLDPSLASSKDPLVVASWLADATARWQARWVAAPLPSA